MKQSVAERVNTVDATAFAGHSRQEASARLCVAYLVNQYPKVSHTFIRREIAALETLGVQVERYSLRLCRDNLVDEADQAELRRTRIVLEAGLVRLFAGLIDAAVTRPRRFASALWLSIRVGWRSDRGILRHFAYLAEASVLLRWFHRKGVNHVHAHFATNPAAVAMLCHILGGPRYSFTAHGPDDFDRARFLALDEKIARARFALSVSSFGRSQLYRWCDRRQWSRIHVLHPGVEDGLLAHPAAPVPAEPRLVCVGRLHQSKGQLLLIDSVRQLTSAGARCELVLVGDGPMRAELQARIAQLRLEDYILLAGPVTSSDLYRYIQAARVVVLPSLAENLPSVILEAFALGRPVIATSVGGISELVEPRVCGWLIPAGSVEALTSAIREALDAGVEVLEGMGRAGGRRVAAGYRSDVAARRLMRMFEAEGEP